MKNAAIILIMLLVAVLGCRVGGSRSSTEKPNGSGGAPASDSSPNSEPTSTATPESATAENTPAVLKKLDFSAGSIQPGMSYDGKISKGARWTDANGENVLIVSERKTRRSEDITYHEIFGYLYVTDGGDTRLLWKIQDNSENYCDEGKGITSPIEVRDIDGDGVAENMFVYNVSGACDVSPIPFKLMMHSGETKLAVRGTNSVDIPDYREKGVKNFDGFENSPAEFKRAASDFWDKYVPPLRAN